MSKEENETQKIIDRIDKLQKRVDKSDLEQTFSIVKPMLEVLGISAQALTNKSLSPSLQVTINAISQGEMPYGEATKKIAIAISDTFSVLEGRETPQRIHSMRVNLLATVLTAARLIARKITVNGLGPLPGDEVDKKRAKLFTLDLVLAFLLKSDFLTPLFERVCKSLKVEEKATALACDLLSLIVTLTMIEMSEKKQAHIEEMGVTIGSRAERLENALSARIVGSESQNKQKGLLALREGLNALRANNFQGLETAITRLFSLANITKEEIREDLEKITCLSDAIEGANQAIRQDDRAPHITITQA